MERALTRKDLNKLGIGLSYLRDDLIIRVENVEVDNKGPHGAYRYNFFDLMNSILFRFYLIENCQNLRITEENDSLSDKRIRKFYRPYKDADQYWFKLLMKPAVSEYELKHYQDEVDQMRQQLGLLTKIYQSDNVLQTWQKFSSDEGQLFTVNSKFTNNDFSRYYTEPLNKELAGLLDTLADNQGLSLDGSFGTDLNFNSLKDTSLKDNLTNDEKNILTKLYELFSTDLDHFKDRYYEITGFTCPLTKDNLRKLTYDDLWGEIKLTKLDKEAWLDFNDGDGGNNSDELFEDDVNDDRALGFDDPFEDESAEDQKASDNSVSSDDDLEPLSDDSLELTDDEKQDLDDIHLDDLDPSSEQGLSMDDVNNIDTNTGSDNESDDEN